MIGELSNWFVGILGGGVNWFWSQVSSIIPDFIPAPLHPLIVILGVWAGLWLLGDSETEDARVIEGWTTMKDVFGSLKPYVATGLYGLGLILYHGVVDVVIPVVTRVGRFLLEHRPKLLSVEGGVVKLELYVLTITLKQAMVAVLTGLSIGGMWYWGLLSI